MSKTIDGLQMGVKQCSICDKSMQGDAMIVSVVTPFDFLEFMAFCKVCAVERVEELSAAIEAMALRIMNTGQDIRRSERPEWI